MLPHNNLCRRVLSMTDKKLSNIFDAAISVISSKGFDKASMEEIALASGVAKGTLYYHFNSKDELFTKLMKRSTHELIDQVKEKLKQSNDPIEKLNYLIEIQINFLKSNKNFCRILLNEVWGTDQRQMEIRKYLGDFIHVIVSVLNEGKNSGQFILSNTETAAAGIFGCVSVATLHLILKEDNLTENLVETTIPSMILNGLRRPD